MVRADPVVRVDLAVAGPADQVVGVPVDPGEARADAGATVVVGAVGRSVTSPKTSSTSTG